MVYPTVMARKSTWLIRAAALLVLAAAAVLSAGCGGPPSVEGAWSGPLSGQGGESGTVKLDLRQEGGSITGGSGELREDEASGGQAILLQVKGGSVGQDGAVEVRAFADGNQPVTISGDLEGDTLRASLVTRTGEELPMALTRDG